MPRKRKPDQPAKDAEAATTTMLMEEQADTIVEPEPAAVVEQTPPEQTPTFVERFAGRSNRPLVPDPFAIALDNEAGVRLFENKQARVMALKFDDKPAQPILDKVKDAGFRWNPTDLVWTKPVRGDSAMATRIDAERLYQEVRQMIRQDKGVDAEQDIPF
jgi:hypothetical protein